MAAVPPAGFFTAFTLDLYASLTGNPERIAIIQPRVARHELPWEKIRN
jgi:hypothetical protein